jgi:uncharacterized protein YndB with AHSA1/START domain
VAEPSDPGRGQPVGISVNRILDAPPAEVWKEWTEPERFSDWFGGPSGVVPLETVTMDVRVGGRWQLTMFVGSERRRIDWWGEYLDVDPPNRLVLTMSDQPDVERPDVITVWLTDLGDGRTEMHFEQGGGGLTPDGYRRAESGWAGFFDRIAERLAGGPGGSSATPPGDGAPS